MFQGYTKQERNFYLLLLFLWVCSIGVLYAGYWFIPDSQTLCPIKALTGIPCPGCGTGHGILNIITFHFAEAWRYNPFSFLLFPFIIAIPCIILYDLLFNQKHLYRWHHKINLWLLVHKWILFILVFLILVNWIIKLINL